MATDEKPLTPTGTCWCGCGTEVGSGSFFAQGHDRIAEAVFMAVQYDNSVARLLAEHDFGPDGRTTVRQAALDSGYWLECPGAGCGHVGTPENVEHHRGESGH
ncbi:hypothetical protein PUR61_01360 [Streptomyces sp. BE20]|uniref:hypothetical protein n=1 Tax=unclassified Streptomyces TaxID=2593676 RepID=UPI002E770284|nr:MULTISPECIES: hypothetical protein [unclassified Streptomyces]MED7950048.1 hypothetical protein [Streptomyces sp. BE303]MEE1820858.1 hypothetical protein [Streptomyces sp. BE20]